MKLILQSLGIFIGLSLFRAIGVRNLIQNITGINSESFIISLILTVILIIIYMISFLLISTTITRIKQRRAIKEFVYKNYQEMNDPRFFNNLNKKQIIDYFDSKIHICLMAITDLEKKEGRNLNDEELIRIFTLDMKIITTDAHSRAGNKIIDNFIKFYTEKAINSKKIRNYI